MDTNQMSPYEGPGSEAPSRWPAVIGIVCIVFAALGLSCYGCGSIQTIASPWLAGMVPQEQRGATAQGAQLLVQVVQACASTVLSAWLLAAGIGLLKRRPWAPAHCVGWSAAKIVLCLLSAAVGVLFASDVAQQFNDQLSKAAGGKSTFTITSGMVMAFIVMSLLWYLVWPVFMLIWFSRSSVRQEVASWRGEVGGLI